MAKKKVAPTIAVGDELPGKGIVHAVKRVGHDVQVQIGSGNGPWIDLDAVDEDDEKKD